MWGLENAGATLHQSCTHIPRLEIVSEHVVAKEDRRCMFCQGFTVYVLFLARQAKRYSGFVDLKICRHRCRMAGGGT